MKPRASSAILSRNVIASAAYFRPCSSSSFLSSAKFSTKHDQRRCLVGNFLEDPTHVGLVWEEGHKSDEELTACIQTDGIRRPPLQLLCTIVQSLYKLEHSTSFKLSTFIPMAPKQIDNMYAPFDLTIASANADMAASGGDIYYGVSDFPTTPLRLMRTSSSCRNCWKAA